MTDDLTDTTSGDIGSTTSFEDALNAAAPPAPPSSDTAPAAAATQPADVQTSLPSSEPGHLPFPRHKEILEHARTEAREAAIREQQEAFRQQYGWVPHADADPLNWLQQQFVPHLLKHPQYAQQYRTFLAQQLAGLRHTAQAEQEPQPDLQAENGALVYSAQQQRAWAEWNTRQIKAEYARDIADLKADKQAREQYAQQQQVYARVEQEASRILGRLQTYPGFTEHEAEITALYASDPSLTPEQAYIEVVMPKFAQTSAGRVLTQLTDKAHAGTANPSRAGSSTPGDYKKMDLPAVFAALAPQHGL
jgi:hypothetical protein